MDDEQRNNKNGTTVSDQYVQVFESLITARKRSLGQGNVFTPVCLFTGGSASRECLHPRGSASRGLHQGVLDRPPFSDTMEYCQ